MKRHPMHNDSPHTHLLMQAIARDDDVPDDGSQRRASSSSAAADRPVGPRKDAVDFADETELVEDETPLGGKSSVVVFG